MSTRLARAHHLVWSALRKVRPGSELSYGAAVLGLLSHTGMHAVDQAVYDRWGWYGGDDHNRSGLFPWEEAALAAYFGGRTRVLLVGAGGGREVLALSRRGMRVDGYECNPTLVASAARILAAEGCECTVRPIARDRAPAEGGPYDAAIVGWSAYTLIEGRRRRIELLRGMRARMEAGAPLLLSFFTRRGDEQTIQRIAAIANRVRARLGREPVETGDVLAPNFIHMFTRQEVDEEMSAAGFRLERFQPQGPGRAESGWAVGRALDVPPL